MDWITGPFSSPFMQRALLAGCLVAVISACVGTYVVLRGQAFMGDALAHGALPGIAVAMLLNVNPLIGAGAGALVMIGGITVVTNRSRLSSDTAIGLLFVGMLAAGVVIVSRSPQFRGDLIGILFGEILAVGTGGIIVLAISAALVVGATWLVYRPFMLLSFDPDQAQAAGYSKRLYSAMLLALVAAAVVVSFQTVGTLLVFAMLLAPASVGALVATRLVVMMVVSAICGMVSVFLGLLASWHLRLAASASISVVAIAVFFIVLTLSNMSRQHTPEAS